MTLKQNTLYALLLLAVGFFAFHHFLSYEFYDGWDDREHIADAIAITKDITHLWSADRQQTFRPPVDVYWVLGYVLGGDMPIYHAIRILLHCLVAFMVCQVAYQYGFDTLVSRGAGVLFLINVGHFRALHWSTTTTYVLCALFCLLALWWIGRDKWTLGILMVPLAVLSHPAGIFIVPMLWYLFWEWEERSITYVVAGAVGAIALSMALFITPHAGQNDGGMSSFEYERLFNPLWYIGSMILTTFWPVKFCLENYPNFIAVTVGMVAVGAVAMNWPGRHKTAREMRERDVCDDAYRLWFLWVLFAFLPYLNHRFDLLGFGPSRQTYIASIGYCAMLSVGINKVCMWAYHNDGKLWRPKAVYCVIVGLVCWISVVGLWRSESLTMYISARGYDYHKDHAQATKLYVQAYENDPTLSVLPDEFWARLAVSSAYGNLDVSKTFKDGYQRLRGLLQERVVGYWTALTYDADPNQHYEVIRQCIENVGEMAFAERLASTAFNRGLWFKDNGDVQRAILYFKLSGEGFGHPKALGQLKLLERLRGE